MLRALLFVAFAGAVVVPMQIKTPEVVVYDLEEADRLFEDFIITYGKEYVNEAEKAWRLQIFKANLREVNERNSVLEFPAFGITKFMDLTLGEFQRHYTGLVYDEMMDLPHCTKVTNLCTDCAPESFDWRDQNKVTPVKDQGMCGSCWAFSTIGTVEGSYAIKHNKLEEFSEQQLLDCDYTGGGCQGGAMSQALMYLKEVGGSMTERRYPYRMEAERCGFVPSEVKVKVTGCLNFHGTEDQLKTYLYKFGPVAIGVHSIPWHTYNRYDGIMTLEHCPSDKNLTHAVLLVGYGTDNGIPYWTIKNSWGSNWGEDGYIRIERGKNTCGMMRGPHNTAVVA